MGGSSAEYKRYVRMASASKKGNLVMEGKGTTFDTFDSTELANADTADIPEVTVSAEEGMKAMAKAKPAKKAKVNGAAKAPKTVRNCVCGCGVETTGYFAPGHDARYHGWVKKLADGRIQRNGKDAKSGEQVVGASVLNKMGLVAKGEGFKANTPEFYKD